MSLVDITGWALLLIGIGTVVGVLLGYGRGFQVFRKQLAEHIEHIESLHAPMRDENERLRTELVQMGATIERLQRENESYEQSLAEHIDEITGLHHALDAQAEANAMEEEEYATAPRKRTKVRRPQQQTG